MLEDKPCNAFLPDGWKDAQGREYGPWKYPYVVGRRGDRRQPLMRDNLWFRTDRSLIASAAGIRNLWGGGARRGKTIKDKLEEAFTEHWIREFEIYSAFSDYEKA